MDRLWPVILVFVNSARIFTDVRREIEHNHRITFQEILLSVNLTTQYCKRQHISK